MGCGLNEMDSSESNASNTLVEYICSNIDKASQKINDLEVFAGDNLNPDFAVLIEEIGVDFEKLSDLNIDDTSIRDARSNFKNYEILLENFKKDGEFDSGVAFVTDGAAKISELKSWCSSTVKAKK